MKTYKLYTDGAYQADANIIGIGGYLIDDQDNIVFEFSKQVHDLNQSKFHEAIALTYGLEKALEHGVENLECYADDVSIRNVFSKEVLSDISSSVNPFRQNIFDLKNQFKTISFYHLPRKYNKKADRLAGKILRIFKEDLSPHRTRSNFLGQENKLLKLPNLVCEEDFQDNDNQSTPLSLEKIINEEKSVSNYFFMHIYKTSETIDNIDDFNPLKINLYYIDRANHTKPLLIASQDIIQKKLISTGLEMLTQAFENYHGNDKNIGIMFHAVEQPLQKIEMLLRQRNILPLPNTPLTRHFMEVTSKFDKIVLHNNPQLIEESLLELNRKPAYQFK